MADPIDVELARPPVVPADLDRFSSNTLFGQPGIYPAGSPMEPAAGPDRTDDAIRAELAEVLAPLDPGAVARGLARFDDAALIRSVPDAGVRAGLVALTGTVAEPVLDGFPDRTTAGRLRYGVPASPGRVVGPPADEPGGGGDRTAGLRVVNERYRHEHPALLAGSLAHDLLWTPDTTGHAAEGFLHALVAMVHVQLVARVPALAGTTELARRQSSLAITLLNSRHPGEARISLLAPDGPGTIPGGAPAMQSPDFWSIPWGAPTDRDAPALLADVLDRLVDPSVARPDPLRYDEALGAWLSEHLDRRWLPPAAQRRALVALGLL